MLNMENAEEVMQILERFTRLKQKEIPKELDDYMHYVAKTGDTVFKWSSLKYLFREKLLNVIKNFHDTSPRVDDLPQYPNVDPFNYESMKSSLLERLELFNAAPFTVQRLCELLTEPRKQYSRIDKFMRALEKNILVSTIEPGRKRTESENGDSLDSVVNGDVSLDVNVEIDMENEIFNAETPSNATSSTTPLVQPSSNLTHKSDDEVLPNPKKPKLDLDDTNEVETEVATKNIINKQKSAEPAVENTLADDTPDRADKKKSEERVTAEGTASDEKSPTAAVVVTEDKKHSESEKMDDLPAASTVDNNGIDKIKEEKLMKKIEEKEVIEEVAKIPSPTSAPVNAIVDSADNLKKTEKIDVQLEGKKKDCTEEVLEKQDTAKEIQGEKVIKEKNDDEEKNGNIEETEQKTETIITTTNLEKTNDKPSEPEETVAPSNAVKHEEVVKEKSEVTTTTSVAVVVRADEVVTSKSEIGLSADPEIQSKPEVGKPADEAVATAETVLITAEKIQKTLTENCTETLRKVDAADQPPPPVAESPQVELAKTVEENKTTAAKEEAETLDKDVKVPAVKSTDIAIPVAVDEPVLTADQPMEENPELIADAAESVIPAIVEAAANVEEVVMGDSVEMATDAVEPAKDEPAGMEVDDTSQEAMDQ